MSFAARTESRNSLIVTVGGHTIKLQGVLNEHDVRDWLYPLLRNIHQTALSTNMPEVVFDIRLLTYANASLWRSLVLWMRLLRESPSTPYSVRLLSDPVYRWQKMGIPPLARLGGERLVIRLPGVVCCGSVPPR
jgi:hypothetical protein